MGVVGGDKAILQQQALVVMGTVAYEGLLELVAALKAVHLITSGHLVKTRLHLHKQLL